MKKKILLLLLTSIIAWGAKAQPRPKLVVGIAVDQMRWDYLYRYYSEYGEGGFKRLMNEGFNCENCHINYIPSVTAVGHTSIFTGSVPSIHGIAGNYFMLNGKMAYCCTDDSVATVGSNTDAGKRSPRNLLTTTIGDELKTATSWQSKVMGVSYKDRAAILPAGHSADAAWWFDGRACRFITSTYYMEKLPKWVENFNSNIKQLSIDEIQYSTYGNQIVEDMAKAIIENEGLGKGETTDILTVSFSCTDIVGHKYGTHHPLTHDLYVALDSQLADFFSYLDSTIGKGQYLVFLSADHGVANSVRQNKDHRIPAEAFYSDEECEALNAYLAKKYGHAANFAQYITDYKVVLNHAIIAETGLDEATVRRDIVGYFNNHSQVMYAVDLEQVAMASIPTLIKEMIINGYNRHRSGDIQLILKPAHMATSRDVGYGTTHGMWNTYDTHIPFLLMGWGVRHGVSQVECHITDIAPTICALIHIQKPNGSIGQPVVQVCDAPCK